MLFDENLRGTVALLILTARLIGFICARRNSRGLSAERRRRISKMVDTLSDIRTRLHQKSHEYFTFEYSRRERTSWRMFYGATDALLDASMAAAAFNRAVRKESAIDLLVCYGFLQALYIQQDAVLTLSRAVGLKWHPNDNPVLKRIRDIRNRLTGHPANAGENEKPRRLSSAVITYRDVRPDSFSGYIYFEDTGESVTVNVVTILRDNEAQLALHMQNIETEMDEQEQKFRAEQAKRPLLDNFGTGFDYLLEKLRCDLDDETRVAQAETHVGLIREIIEKLQNDLAGREFEPTDAAYHIGLIFTALDFMAQMLTKRTHSKDSQDMFYLVLDGFNKNLDDVKSIIKEIDARLETPIV
jgi:hypothetical protein